jgi:hypothetical protein
VRAASILKWCVCQLKRVKASSLVSWLDLWPPPPYINSRARRTLLFGRERRVRTRKAISIRCYYVVIPYFYASRRRRRIHFDYDWRSQIGSSNISLYSRIKHNTLHISHVGFYSLGNFCWRTLALLVKLLQIIHLYATLYNTDSHTQTNFQHILHILCRLYTKI